MSAPAGWPHVHRDLGLAGPRDRLVLVLGMVLGWWSCHWWCWCWRMVLAVVVLMLVLLVLAVVVVLALTLSMALPPQPVLACPQAAPDLEVCCAAC